LELVEAATASVRPKKIGVIAEKKSKRGKAIVVLKRDCQIARA